MKSLKHYTTDPLFLMFPNFVENVNNPKKWEDKIIYFSAFKDPFVELRKCFYNSLRLPSERLGKY